MATLVAAVLSLVALTVLPACGGTAQPTAARASSPSAAPSPTAAHSQAPAAQSPAASPVPSASLDGACLTPSQARQMFFLAGPGHDQLATVSIGTGSVTVILAHQSDGSLCQWWPYAQSLAARFRIIAFDFDGHGASPAGDSDYPGEVGAVARWARAHGGGRIVLMGASMGASAVLVAAASLGTVVSRVVYLSGPAQYAGMDALAAAPHVHVPVLFGYGIDDVSFAGDVQSVRAATATRDKPVLTASNADHGVDLLDPAIGSPKIRSAVLAFIAAVATR